jgi:hypothetical protein
MEQTLLLLISSYSKHLMTYRIYRRLNTLHGLRLRSYLPKGLITYSNVIQLKLTFLELCLTSIVRNFR